MDAVLGTAGHIDHGKTSLVHALTGINCDRLDEEQRRGITIELGFAWLELPGGRKLGIVDVPGHEKFVKNMVAGAAGIDCVLLVVAADEGVMPQTREHLDICTMLGVRKGLVALTKSDTVDPEWLQMVKDDTRETLKGTFLENAPIIPVSSVTGNGLEELRSALLNLLQSIEQMPGTEVFRLPIDRVFSLKGFGTVVTGTVVSGSCNQGDPVCVINSGKESRARTLQVHGVGVPAAHRGQRCAINLPGLEVEDVPRGDVITSSGAMFPSRRWLVRLTCLQSAAAPIRQRTEVHFHHQARECAARIVFPDRMELKPGETALAELRFDQWMAGIFGDHFVIRSHSPLRAIGGGILIDPLPPIIRRRDPSFSSRLEKLEELSLSNSGNVWQAPEHEPIDLVRRVLDLRPAPGANWPMLLALTGLPQQSLRNALGSLEDAGDAIKWDSEQWVSGRVLAEVLEKFIQRADELHRKEPLRLAFSPGSLFAGLELPPKFLQSALEVGINRGHFVPEGNGVRLGRWELKLNPAHEGLKRKLLSLYEENGLQPPLVKELPVEDNPKDVLSMLSLLCQTGQLVKIRDGMYYHAPVLDKILEGVKQWFVRNEWLDASGMKSIFGLSRKYTIPLMEYFDQIKVTTRVGDKRQLRK